MMFSFSLFISRPPENIPSATAGILITPKIKRKSKPQDKYYLKLDAALKAKSRFEQRQTIRFNGYTQVNYWDTFRVALIKKEPCFLFFPSLLLYLHLTSLWGHGILSIPMSLALVTNIAFSFICSQSGQCRHLPWWDHAYVDTFILFYQLIRYSISYAKHFSYSQSSRLGSCGS